MSKCEDESGCNATAIFQDGSAKVCEDHVMSDTPIGLELTAEEAFAELDAALSAAGLTVTLNGKPLNAAGPKRYWFMTYHSLSKWGDHTTATVLENTHPFEQLKKMQVRNERSEGTESHVRVVYTLLSFQAISKEEYDLAERLEAGLH